MSCAGCTTIPSYPLRVTIEKPKPTPTSDANGQVDLDDDANWVVVGQSGARFVTSRRTTFSTRSGREIQVGHQIQAIAPVVIMMPYSSDSMIPDPQWRLKMGTRVFNIIYAARVNETEREVLVEAEERKQR